MILLSRMRELAAATGPSGGWSAEQTESFQNTPYQPSLVPLLVDRAAVTAVTPVVEAYVRALERTLRRYLVDDAMRSWFGLGAAAEALVCAEGEGQARVQVCRLDGYVESGVDPDSGSGDGGGRAGSGDGGGRLWILENNADAPAGTLFTPRVNAYVAAASGYRPRPVLPMEQSEDVFLDVLYRDRGTGPLVRILQPAGRSNRESLEVAAALRRRGADAEVIDPRQLQAGAERFCHDGRPVDVIWNKINTVSWQRLLAESPELVDPWCATLAAGMTRHVNGFAARSIAESKLCHAWLCTEDGRRGLEPAEQAAVAALVPPTTRARRDASIPFLPEAGADSAGASSAGAGSAGADSAGAGWAGAGWAGAGSAGMDLVEAATRHQHELVLKAPYDIRGDGVTVGRAVDPAQWAARLAAVLGQDGAPGEDGVLQRYVAPTEVPVVTDRPAMMRSSLDWFVFDGRVVGLGSKAGVGHKVNLFQGGTKLAVFQEDATAVPA
jgi:hypothetical protein